MPVGKTEMDFIAITAKTTLEGMIAKIASRGDEGRIAFPPPNAAQSLLYIFHFE